MLRGQGRAEGQGGAGTSVDEAEKADAEELGRGQVDILRHCVAHCYGHRNRMDT